MLPTIARIGKAEEDNCDASNEHSLRGEFRVQPNKAITAT